MALRRYRDVIEAAILAEVGPAVTRVVWRPNWGILKEEGIMPPDAEAAAMPAEAAEGEDEGEAGGVGASGRNVEGGGDGGAEADVIVMEAGVRYAAAPLGQKTGGCACRAAPRRAAGVHEIVPIYGAGLLACRPGHSHPALR